MKVVDPGIVLKYRKNKRNMQKLPLSQWNSNFTALLWPSVALISMHTCVHGCIHKHSVSAFPCLPYPSKYQPRKKTSHHSFYQENVSKGVNINSPSALTGTGKIKCLLFPVRLLWRNDRVINIHNHSLSNKGNSKVDRKSLHKLHL